MPWISAQRAATRRTNFGSPLDPDRLSENEFIPIYSYTKGGKYSHAYSAKPKAKYADH